MSLSATRCPSALLGRRWLTVAKSQAWLPAAVASVCCCGVSTLLVCRRPCRAPGPSWRSRGPRAVSSLSWPWFCRLSRGPGWDVWGPGGGGRAVELSQPRRGSPHLPALSCCRSLGGPCPRGAFEAHRVSGPHPRPGGRGSAPCGNIPEAQGLSTAGRSFAPGPTLAPFRSRGTPCCGSHASRTRPQLVAGGMSRLRPGLA